MNRAAHSKVSKKAPPSPSVAPQQSTETEAADRAAVLQVALRRLKRFIRCEPKVLQGDDPEAIHDLRVASRRLQQVVDLLYAKPRPRKIRKLRRAIQRSRQIFSAVRNCDVLMQRLNGLLARKRTSQRETWTAFQRHLEARRSDAFQQAVKKLTHLNLSGFYVRMQDALNTPREGGDLAGAGGDGSSPVAESEPPGDRLKKELQATWESFDARVLRAQSERRPATLHAVRIAAKRLRYLIEVMQELRVADGRKILSGLRRLQQELGEWHDLEVMQQMMAEMVGRPAFLRNNLHLSIQIEKLMLRNQNSKVAYEEKLFESAISSRRPEWQAWVAAVASQPVPADAES